MKTIALAMGLSGLLLAADPAGYHVMNKIPIGGPGGWDYVSIDSGARRMYVSHATHVVVVDLESNKVVGDIPDTAGVHGIAFAPKLNKGFVSAGRANQVVVFDLKTLKPIGQNIATGQNPDSILYDEHSNRLFTFNGRSKDSTVIDPSNDSVVKTIPLGGKPEFAVTNGHGKVWVNIEDTHEIAEIDTGNLTVTKRYNLEGCEEPSGLAVDLKHTRLFSVCANKVMAISDPSQGKVVATVPIGEHPDAAAFDSTRGLAFSSNGAGTLTVVQESGGKYSVAQTVPTQASARTMALDPKTHILYLPAGDRNAPDSFTILVVGK